MGVIKRSIVSITQRIWKSLILLLVVFMLGNVIAASVTVRDATANVEKNMKERLGAYVTVDMNEEYFMKPDPDLKEFNFSKELADKLGNDERVRDFSYSMQHSAGSDDLLKHEEDLGSNSMQMFGEDYGNLFDFILISDKNGTPNDAKSEKIKIKEGRFPTPEDSTTNPYVITLSNEVMEKNGLKVGDKVKLKSGILSMAQAEGGMVMGSQELLDTIEQEYEIIGVFEVKDVKSDNPMDKFANEFLKNTLYTSLEASTVLDKKNIDTQIKHNGGTADDYSVSLSPTYILNSVDDLESFVKDYEDSLPKAYLFGTSQDSFNSVASSIANMNNLSNNVYYFGIVISIVILTLIIVLFLRERKTEFGIYQALGESKAKTMIQIGLEVMIITIVGVSLALFTGSKIADKVSTQMIQTQLMADEEKNNSSGGMSMAISIGGNDVSIPEISKEEVMESYKVEMTQDYIIAFYTVMISASMIATLLSTGYILRLKPREILL